MEEIKEIIAKTPNGQKKYGIADSEARQDVQRLTEGAPEAFDTFKEIAEYIAQDGATAAEIIKNVAANAQGIADEITRAKDAEAALNKRINSGGELLNEVKVRVENLEKGGTGGGGGSVDLSNYYTKKEIDEMPFVTADDLEDAIAEAITNTINTPV